MNGGIVAIWIFLGLFIVALVIIAILIISRNNKNGGSGGGGVGPVPPNPCDINIENLPDVSGLSCCYQAGLNTSFKYDANFGMILAPFVTDYLTVCLSFCPNGSYNPTTKTCDQDPQAFNTCVSQLQPTATCPDQPAVPIAHDGTIFYYGYMAGSTNCTSCCPCGAEGCSPFPCQTS